MSKTKTLQPWYDARDYVVNYVQKSLAGPGEKEVLSQPPLNEIIVGVLHPKPDEGDHADDPESSEPLMDLPYEPSNKKQDEDSDLGFANSADDSAMGAYSKYPTSLGITFAVSPALGTREVHIFARAISYQEINKLWEPARAQLEEPWVIDITSPTTQKHCEVAQGLELTAIVRPAHQGRVRVTVTLLNTHHRHGRGQSDEICWFQPEIKITTPEGVFVEGQPDSGRVISESDAAATDFLYRHSENLAIGHGCAVWWPEDNVECKELCTTFFPRQEVSLSDPSGGSADDPYGSYDLSMATVGEPGSRAELKKLADAYENWIQTQHRAVSEETPSMTEEHRKQADTNLQHAENCLKRIRLGISALENDHEIAFAFSLMNRAMVKQRLGMSGTGNPSWRPFQIAFILLNIPGLASTKKTDQDATDRDIADLLWFPTGGGKTEAYLGCIAFSIFLRRVRNPKDGGVSAIMRYTLRLLTTDQFKRAAALVCGLEIVRKEHLPQATPISLGLWVGGSTTPNSIDEAKKTLSKLAINSELEEGSTPVQLLKCPWCSMDLDYRDYRVEDDQLKTSCPRTECDFHDHLPFHVVDEDVYRVRPSLVIGTVDKFAQITWREKVSELLSMDGKFSAPDLIVQDELHLITGPLGTMVGLYESALDAAITEANGVRPKILASTATVRRADTQVRSVFDRSSFQFPPPGLSPSDNYFSREAEPSEKGTREYVGVFAPGQSQTTQLVWLYSALLQAVESLQAPDDVKDAYWTLLAYFNSLRVLGSAYIQTIDDVPKRVASLASRKNEEPRDLAQLEPLELTSRVASTKIPAIREQMEQEYPDPSSPNVVLATNMISVGLDIDRLGLMVVAGQPQDSSEYIQATSRVGRQHPGLVFVSFNSNKTRDVSHFESFVPFHRALYRAVEATTVTPFSSRARDRGAHGVLVAASRMMIEELRGDRSVSNITEVVKQVKDLVIPPLVSRAQRISPDDAQAFENQLKSLLDDWHSEAEDRSLKQYGNMHPRQASRSASDSLLAPATSEQGASSFGGPHFDIPWQTLTSLRNVDAETHFSLYRTRRED